ncbi:MAG: AraC family transcriptional regulator of adaptative response [Motiliproteus sp.]|jgi:AraC family transcriptional regulator of adaptative response/methylated-DNA-[protein]-cysteine methyltransferase
MSDTLPPDTPTPDTPTPDTPTPDTPTPEAGEDYKRIALAIQFLREQAPEQPSLATVAAELGLSEYHFQRLFSRWAGVSPKRFLQYLTKERAKQALLRSVSLLDASFEAGLSSPGRLHDLMVSCEAMTPGEVKTRGAGIAIRYGCVGTPFGPALLGWTLRGVCHLVFGDAVCLQPETALRQAWPEAQLSRDDGGAEQRARQMFPAGVHAAPVSGSLHLLLRGTNFQLKVWEALLRVGPGELVSYSQLATLAGSPRASRAVGSALAANRIGYLIPCHRVIRESGEVGAFRWGSERKVAMQGWEASRQALPTPAEGSE